MTREKSESHRKGKSRQVLSFSTGSWLRHERLLRLEGVDRNPYPTRTTERFFAGQHPIRHEDTRRDPPIREERSLKGPIGEIRVITGGFAQGEKSNSIRSHVKQIRAERDQ